MTKNLSRPVQIAFISLVLAMASGCATAPPPSGDAQAGKPVSPTSTTASGSAAGTTPTSPPPPQVTKSAGELALADGVDLYHQGNFAAAIRKLQESPEISSESQIIRIEALKYTAFAACSVPGRAALCRQSFDRILELDVNFELTAAEKDHPVWGPVFRQAKQARATRRPAR